MEETYFNPKAKLVLIEDSQLNQKFVEFAFNSDNYELHIAEDAISGMQLIHDIRPDLIIMDVMLPDLSGFEAMKIIKSDSEVSEIPVILLTALDTIDNKLQAFEAGAVDYVTKPFNREELVARVKTNIRLRRFAEQELLTKKEQLVSRIAAGISHNFNNIIGVTSGNLQLLNSITRLIDNSPHADMINGALSDINSSVAYMSHMIENFVKISERKSYKNETEQYRIHELLCTLPFFCNARHSIKVAPDAKTTFNREALKNLLKAFVREIEFISSESSITVTNAGNQQLICSMDCLKINNYLKGDIFEPFTLHLASGSTGVGLTAAKYLAEAAGGNLSMQTNNSETIFLLDFSAGEA